MMVKNKSIIDNICQKFRDSITVNYSASVSFSFLSGKVAYNLLSPDTDIDIVIVLNDCTKSFSKEDLLRRRIAFTQDYYTIHKEFNLTPDDYFPGEVITEAMLEDTINMRGFSVLENRLTLLPMINDVDWTLDTEYRCYLSMLSFNNNKFICGTNSNFQKYKELALIELTKFILNEKKIEQDITKEDLSDVLIGHILKGGSIYLGINESYGNPFIKDMKNTLPIILDKLIDSNFLILDEDKQIHVNKKQSKEWESKCIHRIIDYDFNSKPLYTWEEVR